MATLSYGKPASAGTSCDSCRAEGHHKPDNLYLKLNKAWSLLVASCILHILLVDAGLSQLKLNPLQYDREDDI